MLPDIRSENTSAKMIDDDVEVFMVLVVLGFVLRAPCPAWGYMSCDPSVLRTSPLEKRGEVIGVFVI